MSWPCVLWSHLILPGDGGQGVLRDPQTGSLHHRHQRSDGWPGGDGTQSQITLISQLLKPVTNQFKSMPRTQASCQAGATTRVLPFTPSQSLQIPSSRWSLVSLTNSTSTTHDPSHLPQDVPSIFEEGVVGVNPGEAPPTEGDWTTLVFMPGVHDIGLNFRLHSNRFLFSVSFKIIEIF